MSCYDHLILAADFGGTKGELLVLDAETGCIVRRVFEHSSAVVSALESTERYGGAGRSPQMCRYCLEKALAGLSPRDVTVIGTGFRVDDAYLESCGITVLSRHTVYEVEGIMYAENCPTGIGCVLGTGAQSLVLENWEPVLLIDAFGPVCGDWGGGDSIGYQFLRQSLREQNFSRSVLPEITAIKNALERCGAMSPQTAHSRINYAGDEAWQIVTTFGTHMERTLVASIARVCSQCAENGSVIARRVLEQAARDIGENICRGIAHCGLDVRTEIPVFAAGSVFWGSDILFHDFADYVSSRFPQTVVRRSCKTQPYGQAIKMLMLMNSPEDAAAKIARFQADAPQFFS